MNGPKITEERLRNHLDSDQVMRERMCLALFPLLGPYTYEKPRRPKGGPDGGRDLEAIFQGTVLVWGAVGFRNGGGVENAARREIEEKFKSDLDRALIENPSLFGFVFFTNVDLTPGRIESLKEYARSKNIEVIDIFDFERLRHILDSPEGLITRLQYLDIPMSKTEQLALINKFGTQLQNAVTSRFDRVEKTLAQMQRFLDFQKPLLRLDLYIRLCEPTSSASLGNEAILFILHGLHNIDKTLFCLLINLDEYSRSDTAIIVQSHMWDERHPAKILSLSPFISGINNMMISCNELSLTTVGQKVRISDLSIVRFEAICTEAIRGKIDSIMIDGNGYQLLNCLPDGEGEFNNFPWPEKLPYVAIERKWVKLLKLHELNILFNPPTPSGRLLPIQRID